MSIISHLETILWERKYIVKLSTEDSDDESLETGIVNIYVYQGNEAFSSFRTKNLRFVVGKKKVLSL